MTLKTIYRVQAYRWAGRRLEPGFAEQCSTRMEADRALGRLYENHAGVEIHSVSGDPDFDGWSSPQLIAARGIVPGGG